MKEIQETKSQLVQLVTKSARKENQESTISAHSRQESIKSHSIGSQNIDCQNMVSRNIGSQNIGSQNIGSQNISSQNIGSQSISSENVGSQKETSVSAQCIVYDPGRSHSHLSIITARYLQSLAILLGGCYGLLSATHDQTKAVGILVSQANRFKVFSELVTTAMATV